MPELLELRALLTEQRRTNALLEQLIGIGGTRSELPIRDPADAALVDGLGFLEDGETFRAQSLIDHGEHYPESFKPLLLAADIQTAFDMGIWLRRHRGRVLNGRRLESSERDSDGAIWCFVRTI